MASLYCRRERIWFRVKRTDGTWTCVRSSYVKGQEAEARKALASGEAMAAATADLSAIVGGPVTVRKYAVERWLPRRRKGGVVDWAGDEGKLRDHVFPFLGDMELNAIRARHIAELMQRLQQRTTRKIGRKTRQNVYALLKALFRDAKIDDLFVGENPCILPPAAFGVEHEKDPEWRTKAIFSRAELIELITSEVIPEDRRVFYAVQGIGGARLGEGAALLVRNIDLEKKPLGCMMVARSHDKNWAKGGRAREVPIHPVLHEMLDHWIAVGWEAMMGRPPQPDDLLLPLPPEDAERRRIVPTGEPRRNKTYCYHRFKADLIAVKLRHRREHDLRRTMVSLMREDGARKEILVTMTHNPRKETIDLYTTFTWEARCREVMKLKLDVTRHDGTSGHHGGMEPSTSTALVKADPAVMLATSFATRTEKREHLREVTLWRRRVLPPGPEGLHPGCYVRVRRFDSRIRVGPPTGRPGCQPSLCLAFGPEDAARTQSPLSYRFPRP